MQEDGHDATTRRRHGHGRRRPERDRPRRLRRRAAGRPLRDPRHVPKLAELGFGCTVAGVPQGADAIAESYFDSDLLLAMNSNHRYGSIAAVDAWTDAGFPRPDRDDDHVYWEAGAVLGTGIGGLDTVGEQARADDRRGQGAPPRLDDRRAGDEQRDLGAGQRHPRPRQPGHDELQRVQHRHRGDPRRRRADPRAASPSACCAAAARATATTAGPASTGCSVLSRRFNDEPEKASRPMSATAGGFVPASGAGVLHLESLESAQRRGARIHAEILGGAVNCGGHRGGGSMTAPNPESVRRCVSGALDDARPRAATRSTPSTATSPPPAPTRTRSRRGRRRSSARRATCRRSPRRSR